LISLPPFSLQENKQPVFPPTIPFSPLDVATLPDEVSPSPPKERIFLCLSPSLHFPPPFSWQMRFLSTGGSFAGRVFPPVERVSFRFFLWASFLRPSARRAPPTLRPLKHPQKIEPPHVEGLPSNHFFPPEKLLPS